MKDLSYFAAGYAVAYGLLILYDLYLDLRALGAATRAEDPIRR